MRLKFALVALLALCACASTQPPAPRLFEFHANFWLNLHHFLRSAGRGLPVDTTNLSADERATWDEGVAFYRASYSSRSLLGDAGMVRIKNALRAYEGKDSLAGSPLDPKLVATLERLAPIYRRTRWPQHEAAARAWIAAAQPLLRTYGAQISTRLAAAYGVSWPAEPFPVDLSVEAGANGAYTTSPPTHTVISSTEPSYQGLAALEMVFHEPSHAWGQQLYDGVERAAAARGKKVPPQLWHAVLFYNAGELTRRALAERGISDYVEYAQKYGVYEQLCGAGCRDRVAAAWKRRLDGSLSIDAALDALVADWPQ